MDLAGQENVFFHPGVNALTMRAGKAAAFFRSFVPQGGVAYFAYGRQFGGGRATDEKTASRAFRLPGCRWLKVKAH
jgi:hypothetical protein